MGVLMLTWAQEQRLNWIDEMLTIYGFVNREHIMRKFRVSTPQASADLRLFQRTHPNRIIYDPHLKHYRREPCKISKA